MMIKCEKFDLLFNSLADATRRDMLWRLTRGSLSIGELARPYAISLPAVSKHVSILESAQLVVKRRRGKQQFVTAIPETVVAAAGYLMQYHALIADTWDVGDKQA